mmetsp:Transcript_43408/g.102926  ORF Transcript_43408/g.102926 Transcript_43408/m.102926 type:complete len:156 (+) Transcript_43408:107-574(+)
MGQAQSGDGHAREPYFGVVVSPELLEQLDRQQKQASQQPLHNGTAGIQNRLPWQRADVGMRMARAETERRSELLLSREDAAADRLREQAQTLIQEHYSPAKRRAPPCEEERRRCAECYADNPKDPLRCASAASAYMSCAQEARRAVPENTSAGGQ